jgi:BioD-like phosphotransacetylase family protein
MSLKERGARVGFMKPFGTHPINLKGFWTDHDALLLKEVLNLKEPLDRICPYLLSEEAWKEKTTEDILEDLKSLAQALSRGKDILLIMGSKHIFFDDASCPVPDISLANELKADFVLINRFRKSSRSIYSILSVKSMLKKKFKGIILNRVIPENLQEIRTQVIASLTQRGIPIAIVVPEDPLLSFRSLREISEVLSGEVLWGEGNLDRPVGQMSVGSTALRGPSLLFKRVYNKVILLEPYTLNTEIEDSFAKKRIVGILLTGGIKPAPQVIQAAKDAAIPLILLKEDTFKTLERLEQSPSRLTPKDEAKVRHFIELMDRDGAMDKLMRSLELT